MNNPSKEYVEMICSLYGSGADWSLCLWRCVIAFEGEIFTTSGRGSRSGISFTYSIPRNPSAGGRHYAGTSVEGYGNELWISRTGEAGEKLKKSISRSTVDLAYRRAIEMDGVVTGLKKPSIPGAGSYLYPMLIQFGVIKGEA